MKLVLDEIHVVTAKGKGVQRNNGNPGSVKGFILDLMTSPQIGGNVKAESAARLIRIELHHSIESIGELSVLKNGFQSWSYSGPFFRTSKQKKPLTGFARNLQENPCNVPSGKTGVAVSEMFLLLHDSREGELLIAHEIVNETSDGIKKRAPEQYVSFRADLRRKKLQIIYDIGKDFEPGETFQFAQITADRGEGLHLLEAWCGRNNLLRRKSVPFFGWCSWYHYYTDITADIILTNLTKASELHLPVDVFQIDDGYQSSVGDWLIPRGDFAGRMRLISDEIRGKGYEPGLWMAPFVASCRSAVAKRKNWFVRDSLGRRIWAGYNPLWGGAFYVLDTTRPDVAAYIGECIRTAVHEWDFRYLKLDFLYAASIPGRRSDMSKSRAQLYHDAVKILRDSAGEDVWFLGCGAPISSSAGLFEGMRIGCDVAPRWGEAFPDVLLNSDSNVETRGAIRDTLFRSFMKDSFFMADPDCLIIRPTGNSLTGAEKNTLANAMALSGGLFFLSDDLSTYGSAEMKTLEPVIELWRECQNGKLWPVNWNKEGEPLICINTAGYLGIFNLTDDELNCSLPDVIRTPDGHEFDIKENIARRSLLVRPHGSVVFGKIGEVRSRIKK